MLGDGDGKRASEARGAAGLGPGARARLVMLHLVGGLPLGLQATVVPAVLRARGLSLPAVGLIGLLALPWILAPRWASLVEGRERSPLGRRRTWLFATELLFALVAVGGSLAAPGDGTGPLMLLVIVMNAIAAVHDLAAAGLEADLGRPRSARPERAMGLTLGVLLGGGLLPGALDVIGWPGLFGVMAGLAGVALAVTLASAEPGCHVEPPPARTMAEQLRDLLAPPEAWRLAALVGTYELGAVLVRAMLPPYLVDHGFALPEVARILGTYGVGASLLGMVFGAWLAARGSVLRAIVVPAALGVIPLFGVLVVALDKPSADSMTWLVAADGFFGGALTMAVLAYVRSRLEGRGAERGPSGETPGAARGAQVQAGALASLDVLGRALGASLSGILAERNGYTGIFVLGTATSIVFLLVLGPFTWVPEAGEAEIRETKEDGNTEAHP